MPRGHTTVFTGTIPAGIAAAWPTTLAAKRGNHGPQGREEIQLDHTELTRATIAARQALEAAAQAATAAAERARSVATALDEALAVLENAEGVTALAPSRAELPRQHEMLSPREREVLALVAEGRSNKAIAEALFVSPNTVKTHVGSLMSKLHAGSRAQLAAIAMRQSLSPGLSPTREGFETVPN
jgi:DNA-binding CsgD family transcriptional regulator